MAGISIPIATRKRNSSIGTDTILVRSQDERILINALPRIISPVNVPLLQLHNDMSQEISSSSSSALILSPSRPMSIQRSSSSSENIVLMYGSANTAQSAGRDDALVLYDCEQRSIVAHQVADGITLLDPLLTVCPLCNQPLASNADNASGNQRNNYHNSRGWSNGGHFMSDSYFDILDYMHRTRIMADISSPGIGPGTGTGSGTSTGSGSSGYRRQGMALSEEENPFIFTGIGGGGVAMEEASNELRDLSAGMLVNGYYKRFFVERRRLGVGSFGTVYLCHHVIDSVFLGEFAVKLVPVGDNREWMRGMMKEVKALERLSTHPNIVTYKHSWLEMYRANEVCPYVPFLFILMSYCDAGSLESLIWPSGSPATDAGSVLLDATIWPLFLDVLQGLQHLHRNLILHRDLKPSNILLHKDPLAPCGFHAVLSDFGTAEITGDSNVTVSSSSASSVAGKHSGFTGTVEYTAPEVLGDPSHEYSQHSDMYSLGIVLYAMCFNRVPYSHPDPTICADLIVNGSLVMELPSVPSRERDLRDIIAALTARDPRRRPRCDDLLYHPFVRQKAVETRYSRSPEYGLGPANASASFSASADDAPGASYTTYIPCRRSDESREDGSIDPGLVNFDETD